jgi:hypothetical protein
MRWLLALATVVHTCHCLHKRGERASEARNGSSLRCRRRCAHCTRCPLHPMPAWPFMAGRCSLRTAVIGLRDGMSHRNYINLPPSLFDTSVYRIVRLNHLYELFRLKYNVLVKPEKWKDPYEKLRSRLAPFGVDDHCYGQCWTLQRASDAMWRIYSPCARAVRIRSTIRKLLESLREGCGQNNIAFIGQVRYLNTAKLMACARRACGTDFDPQSGSVLANTLLVKRLAFKHEREVRLILISNTDANPKSGLFRYPVDPNAVIDQIMIDPRLNESEADALKSSLNRRVGAQFTGRIRRSLMYAPPQL